jgi:rare lipoprotein A
VHVKWTLLLLMFLVACSHPKTAAHPSHATKPHHGHHPKQHVEPGVASVEHGRATWYGDDWQGKATASGQRFDKRKLTAAHRTLKMGTRVRVTNDRNGKSVIVRINDRGPYGKDRRRIIDVSEAAARILDFIDAGWCPVTLEVLAPAGDGE